MRLVRPEERLRPRLRPGRRFVSRAFPPHLIVAGLGPAGLDLLPEQTLRVLTHAQRLLLRTGRHPAARELEQRGVRFDTLDHLYEQAVSFNELYACLAAQVLDSVEMGLEAECTAEGGSALVYAVPGHPLLGEESVRLLLPGAREREFRVQVLPAPGFVDVVAVALAEAGEVPDLVEWQVVDGAALSAVWWDPGRPTLIFQVDDGPTASRTKLALTEEYPDEFPVWLVRHAGEPGAAEVLRLPLYQLDRKEAGPYDHLCTLYLPPLPAEQRRPGFREFVEVVARLRAPDGCPWDREQDYRSLRRYVIEEAYEVLDAVDDEDPDRLCEELGDLMLQVLMYSQLGREDGTFDIRDVIAVHLEKLIRRHPHVFGSVPAADTDEVLRNWERIKREEKPERASVLDGVPAGLPALMKALEVSKRVVRVGFEWPALPEVLAKVEEELREFRAELPAGFTPDRVLGDATRVRLEAELGDLLFTLVNVARWLKLDPEEALRQMVARFSRRFREVERLASATESPLTGLSLEELDRLWAQAKAAVG